MAVPEATKPRLPGPRRAGRPRRQPTPRPAACATGRQLREPRRQMLRIAPKTRGLRAIALALSVADFPSRGPGKVENGRGQWVREIQFSNRSCRARGVAAALATSDALCCPEERARGQSQLQSQPTSERLTAKKSASAASAGAGVRRRRADAREAHSQAVRDGAAQAAARARDHAGVRQGERREGRGDLRGARRGRQGRGDQADRRADESPHLSCGRAARADRAREDAVVLPAVRGAPARRRGDRLVRSLLVQPRRRRAGDGVLHRARVRRVHALLPGVRTYAGALGDPADQVLVLGLRPGAGASLPGAGPRSDAPLEAEPDGPRVACPLGRVLARQGRDVPLHRHQGRAVVCRAKPTTSAARG